MATALLVGLLDGRGWLLLQERDDRASVDPNKWSLVGGGVEGETPAEAARRELLEETGIEQDNLSHLGTHTIPCELHGEDTFDLFTVRTTLTDRDVDCQEGRQMVFVAPEHIPALDLTEATRALYRRGLVA